MPFVKNWTVNFEKNKTRSNRKSINLGYLYISAKVQARYVVCKIENCHSLCRESNCSRHSLRLIHVLCTLFFFKLNPTKVTSTWYIERVSEQLRRPASPNTVKHFDFSWLAISNNNVTTVVHTVNNISHDTVPIV